ncbi:MAG: GapR family DNA-binding domain-containing protein [Pseudomonadota bacterium]
MTEVALSNTDGMLKSIVERIEFVNAEIKEKQNDRKEIYTEAKSAGLDVAAIRAVVKFRAEDEQKRDEREMQIDLYLKSLGMFR